MMSINTNKLYYNNLHLIISYIYINNMDQTQHQHHHNNDANPNTKKGHFIFTKAEITLYLIFILANIYLAFFELMP